MAWDLFWRLDRTATERSIRAQGDLHVVDSETGERSWPAAGRQGKGANALISRLRRLAAAIVAAEPLLLLAALPCLVVLPLRFAPIGRGKGRIESYAEPQGCCPAGGSFS